MFSYNHGLKVVEYFLHCSLKRFKGLERYSLRYQVSNLYYTKILFKGQSRMLEPYLPTKNIKTMFACILLLLCS